MGEGKLLAAAALTLLALPVPAQGPVYRERWGYLFLERLRDAVTAELQGRDAKTRAAVAELLAAPDQGVPFAPPARALARLRGVECDDAFLLRASLAVFPLPEIVDPVGDNEACRKLNATVFLPFTVPEPGPLALVIEVRDAANAVAFGKTIDTECSVADLRHARPVCSVDTEGLADGVYDLCVRATVGGAEPRASDPRLTVQFHVLRGYQHRAEAVMNAVRALSDSLDPLVRSQLHGLTAEISRSYQGEAYDRVSTARLDLERVEAALDNLANDRDVLHGLTGDVPIQVPAGDDAVGCVLRVPRDGLAVGSPKPLLLIAGAVPTYDLTARRPTGPSVTGARGLASTLPNLGLGKDYHVAFVESPGLGRDFAAALPAMVASVRLLLRTGDRPVVFVGDRDSAAIAAFSLTKVREQIAGLVCVGAGAMPPAAVDCLGAMPVRFAALGGYPSGDGLRRTLEFVRKRRDAGEQGLDVAWLTDEALPWTSGLPLLQPAITAFAETVFAR